jgi:hypothetical protein
MGLTPLLAAAYVLNSAGVAALISAGGDESARDDLGRSQVDLWIGVGNGRWDDRFLRPMKNDADYGIGTGCG